MPERPFAGPPRNESPRRQAAQFEKLEPQQERALEQLFVLLHEHIAGGWSSIYSTVDGFLESDKHMSEHDRKRLVERIKAHTRKVQSELPAILSRLLQLPQTDIEQLDQGATWQYESERRQRKLPPYT